MTPEQRLYDWTYAEFTRAHGREPDSADMIAELLHAAVVGWNTTSSGYVRRLPLRQIKPAKARVEAVAAAEFNEPMSNT